MVRKVKFIDLFAGIGGIRLGLEQASKELDIKPECVFCFRNRQKLSRNL